MWEREFEYSLLCLKPSSILANCLKFGIDLLKKLLEATILAKTTRKTFLCCSFVRLTIPNTSQEAFHFTLQLFWQELSEGASFEKVNQFKPKLAHVYSYLQLSFAVVNRFLEAKMI